MLILFINYPYLKNVILMTDEASFIFSGSASSVTFFLLPDRFLHPIAQHTVILVLVFLHCFKICTSSPQMSFQLGLTNRGWPERPDLMLKSFNFFIYIDLFHKIN